jgi:tetratricopeptide (TPR) repeat protein
MARLMEIAADMAVVHPERAEYTSPEVGRDASLVRQAIESLETGDEPGALTVLRDLPRSSLLSEWKYFVRGLAAFHRHDTANIGANWGRLEARRAASRIAQRLSSLVARAEPGSDDPLDQELETLVFGEPVIDRLRRIWVLVAEQEWDEILHQIGPLRESLQRIDPKLPERLTRVLLGSLIREATSLHPGDAERLIDRFAAVAQPTAMDPNWNRLRAIIWHASDTQCGKAQLSWSRYLEDLKTIAGFTPQERALARAMVLNHKAGLFHREIAGFDNEDGMFPMLAPRRARPATRKKFIDQVRKAAVDCLEQSLRLAPEYRTTYKALVVLYHSCNDTANVAAAALRLVKVFPDDLETLTLLARHYSSQADPAAALPWAQQARRLKPLDESLRELEWSVRVDLARTCAHAQRFDLGRAEFAAAEQLFPDRCRHYAYLAGKAIFEAQAQETDQSKAFIAEAQLALIEPAPLWLVLAIESIRYRAGRKSQEGYARLWESELKKAVRSETAGEMACLLDSLLKAGIEYPGLDKQVKKLITYLGRSLKLTYRRADLERVCEFLGHLPQQVALLEKLVKRGLKEHPQSARLHFEAGASEFRKGMFDGSAAVARQHLEKAVELVGVSTERADSDLLPQIKEMLSVLNDLMDGPLGPLFFGGLPFSIPLPGRQSRPRGERRPRGRSQSSDPNQLQFPNFFDDDEMGPDWFEPEDTSEKPRVHSAGRGRQRS